MWTGAAYRDALWQCTGCARQAVWATPRKMASPISPSMITVLKPSGTLWQKATYIYNVDRIAGDKSSVMA